MPLIEGTYVPTSKQDIFDRLEIELQEEFDIGGGNSDADITQLSVLSSLVDAFSETLHDRQENELQSVYEAAFLDTAQGEDLDNVVEILGISRIVSNHATGVVQFERESFSEYDYTIQKGTTVQTTSPNPIRYETTEAVVLESGSTQVTANVRAVDGGDEGNVGVDTLTVLPSPPDGVDSVTNPNPVGNDNYTDTNGDQLRVGRDQESDDELRERASITVTKGGAATVDAIVSSLVNNKDLPSVQSVSLYTNRTTNDNTGSGGLPPKSIEAVVYGGREQEIAEALFDVMSITSNDFGGVHGQAITKTVTAVNGQQFDVTFSRPTMLGVSLTLDIVTTENYIGDSELRDTIVKYVGGTTSFGDVVDGIGVGENVYRSTIEDIVTGTEDTGVRGVTNMTTTPTLTTDANGLSVIDVGGGEVASIDATDTDITINKITE